MKKQIAYVLDNWHGGAEGFAHLSAWLPRCDEYGSSGLSYADATAWMEEDI